MAHPSPASAVEVEHRAKIDVQRDLPTSNPFLQASWLGALITAFSYRIFDFYLTLTDLAKESIPDTAVATLSRWAAIWGFTRAGAVSASGNVLAVGTVATNVPLSTVFVASDGKLYTSTVSVTTSLVSYTIAATKLTSTGGLATCETPSDHGLASNCVVSITGAVETDYNVTNTAIIVISANQFTFPILNAPASPATGSPIATSTHVAVPVTSNGTGSTENQVFDTELDFQTPIGGLNATTNVDFGAIGGGTDQEDTKVFRERYLDTLRNPVANFNVADIRRTAKKVAGVTRVFVLENTPAVGEAEIYFMRDGDDGDGIPDASEIAAVNTVIQAIRPATSIAADVVVAGPTPLAEAYTFSAMSPNTPGMQLAVNAALDQFYGEKVTMGADITIEDYQGAIANSVDAATGDPILSFNLTTPTADLTIAATSIGTKGTVTFP